MLGSFSTVDQTSFLQGFLRAIPLLFEKGHHCHT